MLSATVDTAPNVVCTFLRLDSAVNEDLPESLVKRRDDKVIEPLIGSPVYSTLAVVPWALLGHLPPARPGS